MYKPFLLTASIILCATVGVAQPKQEEQKHDSAEAEIPKPVQVVTHHDITINGHQIHYTATAGTFLLKSGEDKPIALIGFTAYTKDGTTSPDNRPITFAYNGGPGSSSIWLHMGALGPKKVVIDDPEATPPAPYKMEDNPYSLLDVTDLVMIDPVGTGFSKPVGKAKGADFWGVDQDIKSVSQFIFQYIRANVRWNSPKFIFGESYGTTRSAVLADLLENKYSTDLNGVILLSQIFNFTADIDAPGANPGVDLPYVLGLPTYAATAWYHKKLPTQPAALEPFLSEVEQFATGPYAHALALGTDLGADEKQQVAEKLHEYTGLPVAYLLKANLRVAGGEFEKTLQEDSDLTTGRLDTRFSGPNLNPLSENAEYDPQSSAISSAYVSLFNDYVRRDLKYGDGQTYLPEVYGEEHWDFKHDGNPVSVNVAPDLAEAMKTNPRLKVMVNGGYYDLATPFFAAQYEDKHLPIPQSLAKNIEYDWYESGHMVYVLDECVKQLHDRVAAFIKSADAGGK